MTSKLRFITAILLLAGLVYLLLSQVPQLSRIPEPLFSPSSGLTLSSSAACFSSKVPDDDVLDNEGKFAVMVWNIHKQADGDWPQALWWQDENWQLLLLQEVGLSRDFTAALEAKNFQWIMLPAFRYQQQAFGVLTASAVSPQSGCGELAAEPLIAIPKGALYSRYALSDGSKLLVVNIHGVNFTLSLADWQAQLSPLLKVISQHRGPVIFAGDFNAWGEQRLARLLQLMEPLGLIAAPFTPDERTAVFGSPLDWVFYRGLALEKAASQASQLSDHAPMTLGFSLLPPRS